MSSANPDSGIASPTKQRRFWHSSWVRITMLSWLSLWVLNALVVIALYNFTLNALIGNIADNVNTKIDKRLSAWPKQLPAHAGVTSWLYRQLAVEIADLQDCVALIDSDGELQLANININDKPEFRFRNFRTAAYSGHRWRNSDTDSDEITCLVTDRLLTDGGHLTFGVPFDNYLDTVRQLNKLRFWGLLLTATFSLAIAYLVSRRSVRGMRALYQVCDRVAAGDLKQRIPLKGTDDDIDHVANAINHMLDQIEGLMEGVREVSDAIAHDLKTPLARLRGQLELLLSISDRSDEAIDAVIAEADQVLSAFNALLRIAQLEQGTRRQAFVHFDFKAVLQQVRDIYELVFTDKDIRFDIELIERACPVYGDRDLWLQAISNLLDNAYKYTPQGGAVTLRLSCDNNSVQLQVSDTGPGIPRGEHKNVFKRFYRLDKHRSQKGTGLGLSLVAAVCKVHQADIELDNDIGLIVRIRIPIDKHAEQAEAA